MTDEQPDNPAEPTEQKQGETAIVARAPLTPSSETKRVKTKKDKRNKDRPQPTTAMGKLWYNWVKPIGSVVVVVVLLRSTIIDWNDVPTGSMEPEIHVGDRIAVNRLAYALQFPLTGPTIGIPFTPVQFDNPLDGIPQIYWGKPDRGDIVTFWNPVTKVRMVKRIIAVPGDTIEMSGGVLTINGDTAVYTDLDPSAEGLPLVTKYFELGPGGKQQVRKDLEYRREEILGESRVVQHIKERWMLDTQFVELGGGEIALVNSGRITRTDSQTGRRVDVPFEVFLNQNPQPHRVLATLKDGAVVIDDKPASWNDLAEVMLAEFTQAPLKAVLEKESMQVDGHRLLIDGKEVSLDVFENTAKQASAGYITPADEIEIVAMQLLQQRLSVLGHTMMTNFGPITLGDDQYYMVGDNRNNSHDSRRFGPVDRGEITGEAFGVAFSFKDNKMFTIPPDPDMKRWLKDLD